MKKNILKPSLLGINKIRNNELLLPLSLSISLLLHVTVITYGFFSLHVSGSTLSTPRSAVRLNAKLQTDHRTMSPYSNNHESSVKKETDADKNTPLGIGAKEHEEASIALKPEATVHDTAQNVIGKEQRAISKSKEQNTDIIQSDSTITHEEKILPTYHEQNELSVLPSMIGSPVIDLPDIINANGNPVGKLVLKIAISASGLVDWIEIEKSELPPIFDAVISDAFRPVRYSPGEINGKKVPSMLFMEVMVDEDQVLEEIPFPTNSNSSEKEKSVAAIPATPATRAAAQK